MTDPSKEIKVYLSYDEHDCDTCGGSYASAYRCEFNGKTYGGDALAHCFYSQSNELDDVLSAILVDLGYTITIQD